MSDVDI